MRHTFESIQRDDLAMSVAQAIAIANEEATRRGVDTAGLLVTIMEGSLPPNRVWRIHYGPRDYVRRRGGDVMFLVDERSGSVEFVGRGQ